MLQYTLIKIAPNALRWYRTRLTLDWPALTSLLPARGSLLEVGCGIGALSYELARRRPALRITGIDINATSIEYAQRYHTLPNVTFDAIDIQDVPGSYDCVLFSDIFHHVPPRDHEALLRRTADLLAPGGYLLIKDIEAKNGQVAEWMDRYISGCDEIYLKDCGPMRDLVSRYFRVDLARAKYRVPFPHYYIRARALPA